MPIDQIDKSRKPKRQKKKTMDAATSASKLPIKRKTPQTPSTGGSTATRSSKYQRIWTEEDEIAFLQCLSQNDMLSSLPLFYETFSSSHPYYSKSQLYDKLRRLRKKFHVVSSRIAQGLTAPSLMSPHDRALYDMSFKLWGSQPATLESGNGGNAADFGVGCDYGVVGFDDDDVKVVVSVAKLSEGVNVGFEGNDVGSDFGVTVVEGTSFGRKGSRSDMNDFGVSVVKSGSGASDSGVSVVEPDSLLHKDLGVSIAKSSDVVSRGFLGNDRVKRDVPVTVIKLNEGVSLDRKQKPNVRNDFGFSGGVNVDGKGKHIVTIDFGLNDTLNVGRKGVDGVMNDLGVSVVETSARANVGSEATDRISSGFGITVVKSSEGGGLDVKRTDCVRSGLETAVGFTDFNVGPNIVKPTEGANVDRKGNSIVRGGFEALGMADLTACNKISCEKRKSNCVYGDEVKSVIKNVLEECLKDVRRVFVGNERSTCSDFEAMWRVQRAAEFDVFAQRLRLALDSSGNK